MSEAGIVGGSRARIRKLAVRAGVGISLALVLGAGVWGWRLMEREVVGVPTIRAAEGPMRVAPQEPGGDLAEHQGLSVSRVAAGAGEVALSPEVYLAPRAMEFAAEDMPVDPEAEAPVIDAMDLAVAEALGLDAASLFEASADAGARAEPRRSRRSARVAVADGGESVQLGAFPEEALATAEWRSLLGRFPELLEGTDRRIERVDRDSRTFWRLRAGGFADLADARRVCAALTAGDAECIPVVRH
jgi:hypothetical protein